MQGPREFNIVILPSQGLGLRIWGLCLRGVTGLAGVEGGLRVEICSAMWFRVWGLDCRLRIFYLVRAKRISMSDVVCNTKYPVFMLSRAP